MGAFAGPLEKEKEREMVAFQNRPLIRDVQDARRIEVAEPRALQISVRGGRQLAPTLAGSGDTLLLFSGLIRFGQDAHYAQAGSEKGEDVRNEYSLYSEVDGDDNSPRTVMLQLRGPSLSDSQFIGASALAALADVFLTTTDTFGAATNNGEVQLVQPVEEGSQPPRDLWFLSDVSAERMTDDTSLINRMAYQAAVLLTTTG